MSRNPNTGDEELGKRIRTLTSLLYKFNVQKSPSKQPKNILRFLSHFSTLLTCSDKNDLQANKVIAVAGSIDSANQARTLVVSQNRHQSLPAETVPLKLIEKNKRPLEEVVKRCRLLKLGRIVTYRLLMRIHSPANAPLIDHVADVWAALSAYTETSLECDDYYDRFESLEVFFLSRSYRKFRARFRQGVHLCGNRQLYEVIASWQPDCPEITAKWVRAPPWLLNSRGLPSIKSRVAQGIVELEFSDDTKKAWSKILEILLLKVDKAIEQVTLSRTKAGKNAEEERQAMTSLNMWCRVLCYFVLWDAGIVKSLLTKTNMVASITTTFVSMRSNDRAVGETDDDDGGDAAEILQEPGESKGQQVYRYLKTVIAWHTAVRDLSDDAMLPQLLKNIQIGLVEVSPSPSSVLTPSQISESLFARFADLTKSCTQVVDVLATHCTNTFGGYVHAEAMLMGLVNYYACETKYTNCNIAAMNEPHMRNITKPMADAGSAMIAVSQKCCWCCDWLGRHLEIPFKLPGTHGKMYPWDPPVVGISVSVLEQLEEALWEELYQVVLNVITPPYSRQSSATGSPDRAGVREMTKRMKPRYDFSL